MTFKINKKSLHFKFLTWYTSVTKQIPSNIIWSYEYLPQNFCQYWRRTIINPILRFGVNVGALSLSTYLIAKSITLSGSLGFLIFAVILIAAAAVIVAAFYIISSLEYSVPRLKDFFRRVFIEYDDDSLIGVAIKSHKENICVDIEYTKDDK